MFGGGGRVRVGAPANGITFPDSLCMLACVRVRRSLRKHSTASMHAHLARHK